MHQKHPHSTVPFLVLILVLFMSVSFPEKRNQNQAFPVEKQTLGLGNSDRIRLKFGSYGIEVLESGLRIRVSNLYSIEDGVRTNRTFAVVTYPAVIEPDFQEEHEAIISGQSIGIVFKENGWTIEKRHRYFGKVETSSGVWDVNSVFGDIGETQPVIHVYSLYVKKNESEFHYASIAEVHHPEYLDLDELSHIYGQQYDSTRVKDNDISDVLETVRTKMLNA